MAEFLPLTSKTSTRIVELHAGSGEAPLEVRLRVIDLTSPHTDSYGPHWEAISYVWGVKGNEYEIIVDGRPKRVWANLYRCLLRLRDPHFNRTLWVDALVSCRALGVMAVFRGSDHVPEH